ncbi:hypothetical protein ACFTSF_20810 [Kribbella sp. NPDC056951]|uniref:DUF7691 family protein n=1 Tax=Kribbella sp. NPDC056951 TaxID=3345978 RepID=UPI0036402652
MSLTLTPFMVRLDEVHAVVGSRNPRTYEVLSQWAGAGWVAEDEQFDYEIADGAPTSSEAALAVINGGPFDKEYGHRYASAYHDICGFMTDFTLPYNEFSGFRSGWLVDVGKGLEHLGITTAKLDDLVYGTLPAPLPFAEDWYYGEWDTATCRAGFAQWQASTPQQQAELHPEVLAAVKTCVAWMEAVVVTDQSEGEFGIAGFLG